MCFLVSFKFTDLKLLCEYLISHIQVQNGEFICFRIFHQAPVEDDFVADCRINFEKICEEEEKLYHDFWVKNKLIFIVKFLINFLQCLLFYMNILY